MNNFKIENSKFLKNIYKTNTISYKENIKLS